MPSQATNYFYTLVAMAAIALMVTNAFDAHVIRLRVASEQEELRGLLVVVATEATELATLTEASGSTVKVCLHLPQMVGYKQYWIRLVSDSSGSWVEGGFGDPYTGRLDLTVDLPFNVSATGTYKGGYGTASLNCTDQGTGPMLTLGRWEVG